ncbi:hypothetical protein [Streptomyces longhuiensis]|uniref:hypothetical protein n=1 Tax=Streptomyces longhuiensis TaxID=2880933 RepID=UPI001D0A1C30|nr:hypothetical protein [Streptomyces longhuiensis]UDM03317.1 hypothetical protein LGI35_36200 [Streptomyces longhuiensis]
MRRYEQRITEAARTTAERWAGYARTGRTFDVGEEIRPLRPGHHLALAHRTPLDAATTHELTAVEAVVAALPTLPADASDAGTPGRRRRRLTGLEQRLRRKPQLDMLTGAPLGLDSSAA